MNAESEKAETKLWVPPPVGTKMETLLLNVCTMGFDGLDSQFVHAACACATNGAALESLPLTPSWVGREFVNCQMAIEIGPSTVFTKVETDIAPV